MTLNKTDGKLYVGPHAVTAVYPSFGLRQTLNNTQTFTIPQGVSKMIAVTIGGGGGGGGSGMDAAQNAGGGGGAGGFGVWELSVTEGSTVGVTIGSGGTGGFSTSAVNFQASTTGGTTTLTYKEKKFSGLGGAPGRFTNTASFVGSGASVGSPSTSTLGQSGSGNDLSPVIKSFVGLPNQNNMGGMSVELLPSTNSFAATGHRRAFLVTMQMNAGDGGKGTHLTAVNLGTGGNGYVAGGGGGHSNASNAARGGNSLNHTGGVSSGSQGGGGAGVTGAGGAASSNVGGVGGAGGGGGGASGQKTGTIRGGAGGAGCVLLYY